MGGGHRLGTESRFFPIYAVSECFCIATIGPLSEMCKDANKIISIEALRQREPLIFLCRCTKSGLVRRHSPVKVRENSTDGLFH